MTDEQAIEMIRACNSGDTERDHLDADGILLMYLRARGHEKVAQAYWETRQAGDWWYA